MAEENFQDSFDIPEFNDEIPMDEEADMQEQQMPMQQQPVPQQRVPQQQRPRPRRPRPPVTPQMAAAQASPMPQQQQMLPQQQAIQQAQPVQAQPARFIPYEIPKKIGLLDRSTGKPVIEDEDMLRVVMAQLADLKNDIEELKAQLYTG